jgi:hypothetical protein
MRLSDLDQIAAAANADGEFQIAARLWNGDLRFDLGDDAFILRMREGRIEKFTPLEKSQLATITGDVRISAPDHDWLEMLKPVPKAFFQDLMAAVTRQNFRLDGDLVAFYPYYRATCRLIEIMRTARVA